MTQPESVLIGLGAAVVALMVVVLVLAFANRRRLQNKPQLADDVRLKYQADLLEAIKKASADQGTVVDIKPFWRGTEVKIYQRLPVIEPLIDDGHVKVMHAPAENDFFETVRDVWSMAMYKPPRHLVLTDRTWTWMVHERLSGERIIIGRVETLNWQKAGRDIVGSPQTNAGGDAVVQTDHSKNKSGVNEGLPLELVPQIVAALRADAPSLLEASERTRVRDLANRLEQAVDTDAVDEDFIEDEIARAERYVGRAGRLMTASAKALEAWHSICGAT